MTIWVDAICINQADAREREAQVQLMGQIFQFATSVYIWLGPGTKASDAVFSGIAVSARASRILVAQGIVFASGPFRDEAWRWYWPCPAGEQFSIVRQLVIREFAVVYMATVWKVIARPLIPTVDELDDVFRRDWFKRVWTFQELVAPSDFKFYNTNWTFVGTRSDLSSRISKITGIGSVFFRREEGFSLRDLLDETSIAARMCWTANREKIRGEDLAY